MQNLVLGWCSPYHTCWWRGNRVLALPKLHPAQPWRQATAGWWGERGQAVGRWAETFSHPGPSPGGVRWHLLAYWGRDGSHERCRLQSEREAQVGISWCQPLCIKLIMSQKGGLVYLILSGGRTLIYAALGSPLPCRFTQRFSMRAASLTRD